MSDLRKWHQLSLRQLLVLVTLAAVCLVIWKWSTKAQRTARALEQIGCHIGYDGTAGGWLERLVGKATLLPVNAVVADRTKFSDAEMRFLTDLPKLKILTLANTSITDNGLAALVRANSLTTLNLAQTKITDDGLRHIAHLTNLKALNLAGTKVSDAGLNYLEPLRELRDLDLSDTSVGSTQLKSLPALDALTKLSLPKTQIGDDLSFLSKVPRLSELDLNNTSVSDSCVPALCTVRDLHFVDVRGTQISRNGQQQLLSNRKTMIIVSDWGVTNASP